MYQWVVEWQSPLKRTFCPADSASAAWRQLRFMEVIRKSSCVIPWSTWGALEFSLGWLMVRVYLQDLIKSYVAIKQFTYTA